MKAPVEERSRIDPSSRALIEPWLVILLTAVVACAVYFRFNNLESKQCWYDEYDTRMRVAGFGGKDLIRFYKSTAVPIPVERLRSFFHPRWQAAEAVPWKAVLQDDFQVSSLYYWTARAWIMLFGDSSAALRYYSVIASLLAMPLLYALCLELFGSKRLACVTLCLTASSPVFLIYSQEIRHYSFWAVTILLSSLTLLRAVRVRSPGAWAAYAWALGACLLVNPLSLVIAAGHGVFVFLRESFKFAGPTRAFLGSLLVASLALVPRCLSSSFDAFTGHGLGWLAVPPKHGLPEYLWSITVGHCARLFWGSIGWGSAAADSLMALALTCLVGMSLAYMTRSGSRDQKLFVNTLVGTGILMLVFRDLVLLGRSATITRYLFPTLIGCELAVGYLLAGKTDKSKNEVSDRQRARWVVVLLSIIAIGWYGSFKVSKAPAHWANWPQVTAGVPEIAAEINRAANPVVLVPFQSSSRMPLVLVERLTAGAGIIPCSTTIKGWQDSMLAELHAGRAVFVWDPKMELISELENCRDLALAGIGSGGQAWRIFLRDGISDGASPES